MFPFNFLSLNNVSTFIIFKITVNNSLIIHFYELKISLETPLRTTNWNTQITCKIDSEVGIQLFANH